MLCLLAFDGTQIAVSAIGAVALVGAAIVAGVFSTRATRKQSSKVSSAVAEVERDYVTGDEEIAVWKRMVSALQNDVSFLEARAKRLEAWRDEEVEARRVSEKREQDCLEALEQNTARFAIIAERFGITWDDV